MLSRNTQIKGASATTGAKPLVSHPGFQRANDKAPWKPNFGAIQHAKFKAASVGLVKEVKVTTANDQLVSEMDQGALA